MEIYIDDMLVKSLTIDQHITNLFTMFNLLKNYNMRLNSTKYAFGVTSVKFLDFIISQTSIVTNPKRI